MEAFHIPMGYERHLFHMNSIGELVFIDPFEISTGSHLIPRVKDPLGLLI